VLGAGGVVGHAFHAGVLSALAEVTGWDARDAEVVVGTSAGSVVGALVRAGLGPADVAAHVTGEPLTPEGADLVERATRNVGAGPIPSRGRRRGLPTMAAPSVLLRAGRQPFQTRLGVLAAAALPVGTISTDVIVGGLRALLSHAWPARSLWVNAVRLDTGARVVFGRDDETATDVATAVAASCAIPGFFAPVAIDGVRYVDGGAHSPTNADLFAGEELDLVVVSSPMSVIGRPLRADLGSRRLARFYLAREAAEVRRAGTPVLTFEPSRDDLAVIGLNSMDGSRVAEVVARTRDSARRRLERPEVEDRLAVLTTAAGRPPVATRVPAIRLVASPPGPATADVTAATGVGREPNGKARVVERGSVQHGARLDDEMAHEVAPLTHGAPEESRAREDLEHEPPGDGEPTPDALVASHDEPPPGGLAHDDVELRSEIARHLRPHTFPADRDALLAVAEQEGASDDVLALLARLPLGVEFRQVSDVWRALGGTEEHRVEAGAEERRPEDTEDVAAATAPAMVAEAFDETAAPELEVDREVGPGPLDVEAAEVAAAELGTAQLAATELEDEARDDTGPRAEAPGCNVAALALHALADATAGAARAVRRFVPFTSRAPDDLPVGTNSDS
jgi:NTE family protein